MIAAPVVERLILTTPGLLADCPPSMIAALVVERLTLTTPGPVVECLKVLVLVRR
jgi:hypothetical protein